MSFSALAFSHVVSRPDDELDLGAAALLLGEIEASVDVSAGLADLDELAADVPPVADPAERLARLTQHLFTDLGYHGDTHYEDPRNSFLADVLARRVGIPIALSVLAIEVGRRAGVKLDGIGFPGHFLVAARLPGGDLLLDCFHGGRAVDRPALEAMLGGARVTAEHLQTQSKKQILTRMLNNLRRIYDDRGDATRLAAVDERLEILSAPPGSFAKA